MLAQIHGAAVIVALVSEISSNIAYVLSSVVHHVELKSKAKGIFNSLIWLKRTTSSIRTDPEVGVDMPTLQESTSGKVQDVCSNCPLRC